jgi:hypothetical protein
MTPFQRYAWRRYGFMITDNHRHQVIRGIRYPPATVIEITSWGRIATDGPFVTRNSVGHEVGLWNALRRRWQAEHKSCDKHVKGGSHA